MKDVTLLYCTILPCNHLSGGVFEYGQNSPTAKAALNYLYLLSVSYSAFLFNVVRARVAVLTGLFL